MRETLTTSEPRLAQIQDNLTAEQLRLLLTSRPEIERYLTLGEQLGAFALSTDSEQAQRDILVRHAPASVIAVIVDQDIPINDLVNDPIAIAGFLLNVAEKTQQEQDSPVTANVAREQLTVLNAETAPLSLVIATHQKSHPAWFALINHGNPNLEFLAPSDIAAIYNAIDQNEWKGATSPDIDRIVGDARESEAGILS